MQQQTSSAEQVFGIFELREQIFLDGDPADLLDYLTNLSIRETVRESKPLRQMLYLNYQPAIPIQLNSHEFHHHQAIWEPNRMLCAQDNATYNFRIAGQAQLGYEIKAKRTRFTTYYVLNRWRIDADTPWGRTLPDSYLDMHLSDRKVPIAMSIMDGNVWLDLPDDDAFLHNWLSPALKDHQTHRTDVWIPEGTRLRDVLHWVDTWSKWGYKDTFAAHGMVQFALSALGWPSLAPLPRSSESRDDVQRRKGKWVLETRGRWLGPAPRLQLHDVTFF